MVSGKTVDGVSVDICLFGDELDIVVWSKWRRSMRHGLGANSVEVVCSFATSEGMEASMTDVFAKGNLGFNR